jgi:1,4-alpha-glucan branching enzyme
MITKKSTDQGKQVKVTFSVPVTEGPVSVAGEFNDWDPTAAPMRKRGELRSVSMSLEAGRAYAFRYVDEHGRWFNDEHADRFEANQLGDTNCIIDLTDRA